MEFGNEISLGKKRVLFMFRLGARHVQISGIICTRCCCSGLFCRFCMQDSILLVKANAKAKAAGPNPFGIGQSHTHTQRLKENWVFFSVGARVGEGSCAASSSSRGNKSEDDLLSYVAGRIH